MFDIGIISIYLYFTVQYVIDNTNLHFPHNLRASRAAWMAVVGVTILWKILRPADFEL